jgi:hypothetical protein
MRRVMLWANRNGFYYVLDRITGQLLQGKPFAKVTWTTGLDDSGHPSLLANDDRVMKEISIPAGRADAYIGSVSPKVTLWTSQVERSSHTISYCPGPRSFNSASSSSTGK